MMFGIKKKSLEELEEELRIEKEKTSRYEKKMKLQADIKSARRKRSIAGKLDVGSAGKGLKKIRNSAVGDFFHNAGKVSLTGGGMGMGRPSLIGQPAKPKPKPKKKKPMKKVVYYY